MEVVANSIKYFSGQPCVDAFEVAAKQVAFYASIGIGSAGMKQLETDFQTCSTIETDLDYTILLSDLMGNVQGNLLFFILSFKINIYCIICLGFFRPQNLKYTDSSHNLIFLKFCRDRTI